jgi:hypothetical protein
MLAHLDVETVFMPALSLRHGRETQRLVTALALCVPIVAKHDKLDDKQWKQAARFYAYAAMKLLRDAGRSTARTP